MKSEPQRAPLEVDEAAPAELLTLPLDLLVHVAGGLPFNGVNAAPPGDTLAGPEGDLPFNGV